MKQKIYTQDKLLTKSRRKVSSLKRNITEKATPIISFSSYFLLMFQSRHITWLSELWWHQKSRPLTQIYRGIISRWSDYSLLFVALYLFIVMYLIHTDNILTAQMYVKFVLTAFKSISTFFKHLEIILYFNNGMWP